MGCRRRYNEIHLFVPLSVTLPVSLPLLVPMPLFRSLQSEQFLDFVLQKCTLPLIPTQNRFPRNPRKRAFPLERFSLVTNPPLLVVTGAEVAQGYIQAPRRT